MKSIITIAILCATTQLSCAEVYLDKVERSILGAGLHRTLQTNVTYTATKDYDLQHCSFVFRENITSDMYIYYEEVTASNGMYYFETWPHHLPMDIEAPKSKSKPQEFIWRLPLKEREPNNYMPWFTSSA